MVTRALSALHHTVEASFVTTLEATRGIELVRRCPDVADLLAAAAAGLAEIAFVSADLRLLDRDVIDRLARGGVRVVGVAVDEQHERTLRQLGVSAVASAEVDPPALADQIEELLAAGRSEDDGPDGESSSAMAPAPTAVSRSTGLGDSQEGLSDEDQPAGRIVAVWGPTGAPGRTTLAVNLAAALALSQRVLLIDADTWGASVAQALAVVDEAPGIAAAARAADQGVLDRMALARLAPTVPPGFRVLTGLPKPERWPELRPPSVSDVLRVARTIADVIIVDCGFSLEDDEELSYDTAAPRRNGATLTVLAEADQAVVVGAADPVGLQRLVRAVQELAIVEAPVPTVVVNKVRAGAVGSKPERLISEALARFSGLDDLTFLPWDLVALDGALLAGSPVVSHDPSIEFSKAVSALATRLAPVPAAASGGAV